MTEREYIFGGGGGRREREGGSGQEEGTYIKMIHTPKKAPVNLLKLSQNSQWKVMLVTHLV